MKKALFSLLSVLLLALAFPALAEPYTFFNGAQWGMRKAEIAEIEKAEPDHEEAMREHVWVLEYDDQTVSRYTADRAYVFADDELFSVWYVNFSSNDDKDLKYLQGALTSLYGEATALPPENIMAFMANVLGMDLSTEEINKEVNEIVSSSQWTVGDDTDIWLFNTTWNYDENAIYLFYINANFDGSQIGIYNTIGL